jgi:hypothetical protein
MILTIISATKMGDAIYIFGGARDVKYSKSEQWYGEYYRAVCTMNKTMTRIQDHALLKLDLSTSWNYMLNDRPMTALSSRNTPNGPPPFLMYGSITYDYNGDFHIDGGGRAMFNYSLNTSAQQPTPAMPVETSSWVLSSKNGSWASEQLRLPGAACAPIYTLYTQAPEHDLAFYLNGILSNGSSERAYPRMMIVNTRTNSVRTVSTGSISPSAARVGAIFEYLPLLGEKGALLLFGGAIRHDKNITGDLWDTMVFRLSLPQEVILITANRHLSIIYTFLTSLL